MEGSLASGCSVPWNFYLILDPHVFIVDVRPSFELLKYVYYLDLQNRSFVFDIEL